MRQAIAVLTALSFSLATGSAHAQDIVTIPPGDDKITTVHKGEVAPYTGQLFSTDTSLRWGFWLEQYRFRLKADVAQQKALGEADRLYWQQTLLAEQTRYTTVVADFQQRLTQQELLLRKAQEEAASPPWYRSVWFGVTLGVVLTGAAVGVTAYGLGGTR